MTIAKFLAVLLARTLQRTIHAFIEYRLDPGKCLIFVFQCFIAYSYIGRRVQKASKAVMDLEFAASRSTKSRLSRNKHGKGEKLL
jgi:hypothetical protein